MTDAKEPKDDNFKNGIPSKATKQQALGDECGHSKDAQKLHLLDKSLRQQSLIILKMLLLYAFFASISGIYTFLRVFNLVLNASKAGGLCVFKLLTNEQVSNYDSSRSARQQIKVDPNLSWWAKLVSHLSVILLDVGHCGSDLTLSLGKALLRSTMYWFMNWKELEETPNTAPYFKIKLLDTTFWTSSLTNRIIRNYLLVNQATTTFLSRVREVVGVLFLFSLEVRMVSYLLKKLGFF